MPRPRFNSLSKYLLDCGVAPKFAARISAELHDHYADLEQEMLEARIPADEAAEEAQARLGAEAVITEEFLKRPELRRWMYRSTWLFLALGLLVSVVELVLTPLYALAALALAPLRTMLVNRVAVARYLAATGAAAVVTVALLFTMQFVLGYAQKNGAAGPRSARVSFLDRTVESREEAATSPERDMPPRPTSPDQRPLPAESEVELLADIPRSSVDVAPSGVDLMPPGLADGDFLPIVKVAPVYPALAASRGLEGYVVVEFTVTPTGTVRDVIVVESSSDLFHEAAIDATVKFKYKPRVVSGRPVEVSGVRNRITFALEA